ncbi:hypothetical protein, partial [Photobacterium phosphoreum]|uniref:hypothetical protein n=1 Tax=Photobacterium phosphoreum TaxID=659 RepID=UPI001E4C9FC4|nr:hypothetical protein [Photobacterium phosphoreum]
SAPSKPQASKTRSAAEKNVDARIADMLGKPAEFQDFFKRLQKAVAASDHKTLAKMMRYPLSVTDGAIKVFNKKDFTDNYDKIFTPTVITAVKNQTYADLFVKDTGAAVGSGLLWFTGVCTDNSCKLRIPMLISVYAPSEEIDTATQAPIQPSVPAPPTGAKVIAGSSLPIDTVPGAFGPCRDIPVITEPSSLTITGALEPDSEDCYRLTGHNGQSVHIELVSVSVGFSIDDLADNRYEFDFKPRNQTYDILLAHTFPSSLLDHYELHFRFK